MAYTQKRLRATFKIADGVFDGGGNSLTVSDLRMSFECKVLAGGGQSYARLDIYGLSLSHANRLSVMCGTYNRIAQETVDVEAGDAETGMALVYSGDVLMAAIDAEDLSRVRFSVDLCGTAFHARKPTAVTSRKGAIAGETLMQSLAKQMGLQFENSGVHVMLSNPYLWGTAISQARQLVEAMNCQWLVHNGKMTIWPTGKSVSGGQVTFSPQTGMVGYPLLGRSRVGVKAYYNPSYDPPADFQVQSSLTPANGLWHFQSLEYELDAYTPHGRWFMTLWGTAASSPNVPSGAND